MTAQTPSAWQTPDPITNRPALSAIGYRAGRYATFYESMIAALSGQSDPQVTPIRALATRDPGDFSIALLDSWAVVLDILTFYSERLANEAYLRTAVEARSVTELAALVGYAPSPGVSASVTLAFTLSTAPGSAASVPIPAGTRVQSVPGPGQTAQVFETAADLDALAAWNALPAQAAAPWSLTGAEQSTWITGTASNIRPGDGLLFVAAPGGTPSPEGPSEFHLVTAVTTDPVAQATQLTWDAPLSAPQLAGTPALYTFRTKAALYGASAPSPQLLSGPNVSGIPGWPATEPGEAPGPNWTYQYDKGSLEVSLDASYPGLAPAAGGPVQWAVLTGLHLLEHAVSTVLTVTAAQDIAPNKYGLTARVTTMTAGSHQLLLDGGPWPEEDTSDTDTVLSTFVTGTPLVTAYVGSVQLTGAPLPLADWSQTEALYSGASASGAVPAPVPGHQPGLMPPVAGTTVTVTGGQQIAAGQAAGLSGRRLRLQVAPPPSGTPAAAFTPAGSSGGSAAASGQEFLLDAYPPVLDADGNAAWSALTVSGVAGTLLVPPAIAVLSVFGPAAADDPVTGEAVTVVAAAPAGDLTTLTLAAPLARIYDRSTVTVNANAVLATNGETVQEILGSGDASNPALAFTLKQAPLTYVTAPSASGASSSLQVWVNNLRWQQAPSLLDAGPADRVYTTGLSPAGNAVVQFGDGTRGGRPPTGQANIRAVYRTGTGLAGMVSAGQLTQALDRPAGVSAVTNPGPATGGADPASAGEVRASAPLPTLTLSRVVSLEDYQNFAAGFAGVGKALATWTWTGSLRGVLLTVAGAAGAVLTPADPLIASLLAALRSYGDPHVPVAAAAHRPVLFTFTAAISVDTTSYDPAAAVAQAWQAVSAAYAFSARSLGQAVVASEIIEVIQSVPGVLAVRLTGLRRSGQPADGATVLRASGPQAPAGTQPALGAELLVLDPATRGQIGPWS